MSKNVVLTDVEGTQIMPITTADNVFVDSTTNIKQYTDEQIAKAQLEGAGVDTSNFVMQSELNADVGKLNNTTTQLQSRIFNIEEFLEFVSENKDLTLKDGSGNSLEDEAGNVLTASVRVLKTNIQ